MVECDERSRFDRIVMAKRREGKAKRMSEVFRGRGVGWSEGLGMGFLGGWILDAKTDARRVSCSRYGTWIQKVVKEALGPV